MGKHSALFEHRGEIALVALVLLGFYLTSLESYLLFHSLIELFTIIVGTGIFVIAWNSRGFINNNYLLFIGIASVFVASIDLLHVLAYPGMGAFSGDTSNLSPQLWLAARYLRSLSWLAAPFVLGRRLRYSLQIVVYMLVTGALLLSIFYWKIFPTAYVIGPGLTPFKIASEYVISASLLLATGLLLLRRSAFDPGVLRLLVASLLLTALAETMFTSYVSFYEPATTIGHLLRFVAYYLLYKAIIQTGLVKPYSLLLLDVKRSEEKLRQSAADLQAQNADLVRTEDRLRAESAALLARNDELDAYAHTVAHDLKNPLAVIIATGDVINHVTDLSRGELQEFLLQMKSTAYQMNTIIDSLLLLSEVRKVDAPLTPIDMGQVVCSVGSRLDYLIKQHRARLVHPDTWPAALGYGPWIEEVWANYISNALKYGGPSPCVELGASPEPDGMIRFWTRDNGPGIPPEARDALFTPFTQLRKAHKEGHGLGLSIVLRIVQKLGGRVGVQSVDGHGSEFYFTLPAAA